MSSTVRTIINGQEYTRETAYSTVRYYFDYNFYPDSYSDLEKMMDAFQMELDVLNMGSWTDPMYDKQVQECKLCISLIPSGMKYHDEHKIDASGGCAVYDQSWLQ